MKAETADYLTKARTTLQDARRIAAVPLPHVAAREAYLAVFHTAQAYIFEQTGKVQKRIAACAVNLPVSAGLIRASAEIWWTFLGTAYQFKTRSDYAIGSTATPITDAEATAAIDTAAHLIDTIAQLLP